ncbi:hypothetical protein QQP08_002249 [Theobroma cacao]|nr:hypothetical protein QQP08_002249 [Theobroma cacao]
MERSDWAVEKKFDYPCLQKIQTQFLSGTGTKAPSEYWELLCRRCKVDMNFGQISRKRLVL